MSNSYSAIFNEIFKNDNINTDFIHFFDKAKNTLSNDYMPAEVIINAEQIAELQAFNATNTTEIADLEAKIQGLENYITDLKAFINTFKSAVYIEDVSTGQEYNYNKII